MVSETDASSHLPRWWTGVTLSRIFQFLSSLNRTYKQVLRVPFSQILLKDSEGYYSKTSFIKSEVVCNGVSHLAGSPDDFLLNKWMSECQVLLILQ